MSGDLHLHAYQRARPQLLEVARRVTGSRFDAEDVCQETWLRWSRVDRPIANPTGYLVQIARNVAISRVRRDRRTDVDLEEHAARIASTDWHDCPDAALERVGALHEMFQLLLTCAPPLGALVLVLRDLLDLRYREIADMTGRSECAIRQTVSRARAALRAAPTRTTTACDVTRRSADELVDAWLAGDVGRTVDIVRVYERQRARRASAGGSRR